MPRPKTICVKKLFSDEDMKQKEGHWFEESDIHYPIINSNTDVYTIDEEGNSYVIQSKSGKVSEKDKNILILKEVIGVIKIKDTDEIIILSDIAEYNKITLDTHFYHNVKLAYEDHSINSDSLFMNYIDKNINIRKNRRNI